MAYCACEELDEWYRVEIGEGAKRPNEEDAVDRFFSSSMALTRFLSDLCCLRSSWTNDALVFSTLNCALDVLISCASCSSRGSK